MAGIVPGIHASLGIVDHVVQGMEVAKFQALGWQVLTFPQIERVYFAQKLLPVITKALWSN
jgi:hypothetical protein